MSEKETKIKSFEELEVYQKLCELHLEINQLSLKFPPFERYELASQVRRSSNSTCANLAEGWSNKHIKLYLEGINRSLSEIRETKNHLYIASRKNYLAAETFNDLMERYEETTRMLKGLEKSLQRYLRPITQILNPET